MNQVDPLQRIVALIKELENDLGDKIKNLNDRIEPVRQSVWQRYPILFTLLVTIGVTATFLGLEKILEQFEILNRYPWLILIIGISILVITGRLMKKLG